MEDVAALRLGGDLAALRLAVLRLALLASLSDIHIQRAVETQQGLEREDDLPKKMVQVGVGRTLDVQVAAAYSVQSLVQSLVRAT